MRLLIYFLFFFISVTSLFCNNIGRPDNNKLILVLQWEHQAQFAGYYMALEKGFFKEKNLDVTIISGGADVDPLDMVNTGRADFCTAMLSSVLDKYDDKKMVLLRQIINRSNLAFVAWKNGCDGHSAISDPIDLAGKRISMWEEFRTPYMSFFDKYNIVSELLPQYYTFSLFLHKGVDACSAMLYNEYHKILQNSIALDELTIFQFYELGINLPEDGIYTLNSNWDNRPEVCEDFAVACFKGWEYARENKKETLNIVMRYIENEKLSTNRAHMEWMLNIILDSIFPANGENWKPGTLSLKIYQETIALLKINGRAPKYSDFVTRRARNEFDD